MEVTKSKEPTQGAKEEQNTVEINRCNTHRAFVQTNRTIEEQ